MLTLAWISAALAWLPLLLASANLPRFRRPAEDPPPGTRVSILIPARNEAATIDSAVRGALASTGVEVEVVVLDDGSTDETAAIVNAAAASDQRLRLLRSAAALPAGWAGKQRACHLLSRQARFEVLMFVDADVVLAPAAAAMAAGLLLRHARLGMVSGFPREQAQSLAERTVIPWIHVLLLGYLPLERMRQSSRAAFGAACGQWVVAWARAYRNCGGHAAAPDSRHDGTSLPRTFRNAGWLTDVFDGSALATCRMYRDWSSVWHGFGKSAGEGMATAFALPLWTLLIGGGHLLPPVLVAWGLFAGQGPVALAAALGMAANLGLRLVLCLRLQQSWLGLLLHPVGAAFVLLNQWAALLRHLRGLPSEWRGRRYVARKFR